MKNKKLHLVRVINEDEPDRKKKVLFNYIGLFDDYRQIVDSMVFRFLNLYIIHHKGRKFDVVIYKLSGRKY